MFFIGIHNKYPVYRHVVLTVMMNWKQIGIVYKETI